MNKQEKLNCIGFLFCGLVIFLFIDYIFDRYSMNIVPQDYFLKQSIESFEKKCKTIDIVFLGGSSSYYGINPKYINLRNNYKSHNFAFASEPPITTYYKLLYYLQKGYLTNLKLVVIDVTHYPFSSDNTNTLFKYYRFYNYSDILVTAGVPLFLQFICNASNAVRLQPYLTDFRFPFSSTSLDAMIETEHVLENGYCRRDFSYALVHFKNGLKNLIKEGQNNHVPNTMTLKYLNKLVTMLNAKGIRIVFIMTPDTRILYDAHCVNKYDWCELKRERVIKQLYKNITIFNYASPTKSRGFTLKMFSDVGHLNFTGSKLLSTKISRDLNRYFKKNSSIAKQKRNHPLKQNSTNKMRKILVK